jgi:hypothetical protein
MVPSLTFYILLAFNFVASSEELSEEDKQKKEQRERMRQEYYFAIQEEGRIVQQ